MATRTTTGKAAIEPVVIGDHDIAAQLVQALADTEPVQRATHGFHTYPAGLHPDAARRVVALVPGRSVLDPFCGGGTVLVEAMLQGRQAVGRDISPVALRVARGRTAVLPAEVVSRFRAAGRRLSDASKGAMAPPPEPIYHAVQDWYHPHVLCELESLRAGIAASELDIRPLLELAFSAVLVKSSFRKADTSAQRVRTDRPRGTTSILFHKKTRELGRMLDALREAVPPGGPSVDIRYGDAREIRVSEPVDAVVTSPPYPSTYDYVPLQHLRLVWLGESRALEAGAPEIGARRQWRDGTRDARRRWAEDTTRWMRSATAALVSGGHFAIAIGDGLHPAGGVDASEPTSLAAKAAGLVLVARASVERPDFAREQNRWEHLFLYRKP